MTASSPLPPSALAAAPTKRSGVDGALPGVEHSLAPHLDGTPTKGESRFDTLVYGGNGIGTFFLSVAAMYLAKHSPARSPFSRSGESFSAQWSRLASNTWLGEKGLTSAALSVGGTLLAIPVRLMEGVKKPVVHWLNEKFSTAEETARGDARVDAEPKQTWGSILKGRLVAMAVVFTSLEAGDFILKRGSRLFSAARQEGSLANRLAEDGLGVYGQWVGDLFARARSAIGTITDQQRTFWQRMGEITAVDLFATIAATLILKSASRFFSQKSANQHTAADASAATPATNPSIAPTEGLHAASSAEPDVGSNAEARAHARPTSFLERAEQSKSTATNRLVGV